MPDIVITHTVSILSMRTAFTRPHRCRRHHRNWPPWLQAGPLNVPAFRRLHHHWILQDITGETDAGRVCFDPSGRLPESPCLVLTALFVCLTVCLTVCPLCRCPCSSFCLTSHYCNALEQHGSFISVGVVAAGFHLAERELLGGKHLRT